MVRISDIMYGNNIGEEIDKVEVEVDGGRCRSVLLSLHGNCGCLLKSHNKMTNISEAGFGNKEKIKKQKLFNLPPAPAQCKCGEIIRAEACTTCSTQRSCVRGHCILPCGDGAGQVERPGISLHRDWRE